MPIRAVPLSLALCAALCAPRLIGADAMPAPAPAAAAPVAAVPAQPTVNQDYLQKCVQAASLLVDACKASGNVSKLGGLIGAGGAAPSDDRLKRAEGLVADLQSLQANKQPPADGSFTKLVVEKKDGIASAFKGFPIASKLQAAFGDGGIGKALLSAVPVDSVPGYQKCLDALNAIDAARK